MYRNNSHLYKLVNPRGNNQRVKSQQCAAGGCFRYAGLGSPAYSAAKTFHRFHAAFKSLCIWNASCGFFTLALCDRTAAWSPSPTIPPPA